jgi:hypothetical protein
MLLAHLRLSNPRMFENITLTMQKREIVMQVYILRPKFAASFSRSKMSITLSLFKSQSGFQLISPGLDPKAFDANNT